MPRTVIKVVDLLVDDDARATWARLTAAEQTALVKWVNKPSTNRARQDRHQEAIRTLQLGGSASGLTSSSVLESILTSLPWGTP